MWWPHLKIWFQRLHKWMMGRANAHKTNKLHLPVKRMPSGIHRIMHIMEKWNLTTLLKKHSIRIAGWLWSQDIRTNVG